MAFSECKWCHGQGCLYCETEREKVIDRGPQPIFTADLNNPHDVKLLNRYFGREAIEKAFRPDVGAFEQACGGGGGGAQEIERNAAIASLLQFVHKEKNTEEEIE